METQPADINETLKTEHKTKRKMEQNKKEMIISINGERITGHFVSFKEAMRWVMFEYLNGDVSLISQTKIKLICK